MKASNSPDETPWWEMLSADDDSEDCDDCVNGLTDEFDPDSMCKTCSGLGYIPHEVATNHIRY